MASFGEQLTDLMLDKNIKSHELAAVLGINTSSVNDWKRGKFNVFLSNALKLADFFGCSLDFLMGRSDTVIDFYPVPCSDFYSHFMNVLKSCGVSTYRMIKDSPIKGAIFTNGSVAQTHSFPLLSLQPIFWALLLITSSVATQTSTQQHKKHRGKQGNKRERTAKPTPVPTVLF